MAECPIELLWINQKKQDFPCEYITIVTLWMIIFDDNSKPYDIHTLEPRNQKHKLRTRKLIPFGKLIKSLECSIQRSSMRIKFGNAAGSAHNGRNFQILGQLLREVNSEIFRIQIYFSFFPKYLNPRRKSLKSR